jgi:hypothetical protein
MNKKKTNPSYSYKNAMKDAVSSYHKNPRSSSSSSKKRSKKHRRTQRRRRH